MSFNVVILHWVVIVTLGNYSHFESADFRQPNHFKSAEFVLVVGFSDDLQDAVFVLVLSCF